MEDKLVIYSFTFKHKIQHLYYLLTNFDKYSIPNVLPVTGLGGLYGCERFRIPHCLDIQLTDGGEVVILTHQPLPALQKHFLVLC
jgi:hypothetical protein